MSNTDLTRFDEVFQKIGKPLMDEITRYRKSKLLKIPDLIAHLKNFTPKSKKNALNLLKK
jgi:hypothetical protein